MKCSIKSCLEEKGNNDRLFCTDCRVKWREVVDLNYYDLKTSKLTIKKGLSVFQTSGL